MLGLGFFCMAFLPNNEVFGRDGFGIGVGGRNFGVGAHVGNPTGVSVGIGNYGYYDRYGPNYIGSYSGYDNYYNPSYSYYDAYPGNSYYYYSTPVNNSMYYDNYSAPYYFDY